jgi:cyclophilin family peptidyl-prolyl cis-trans isomerase
MEKIDGAKRKIKQIMHVLNPLAGKGRAVQIKDTLDAESKVYMSSSCEDANDFIIKACKENPDTCFTVYGGDGTVFRAVNALMNSGCADSASLKIVPVGSGNDFVRSFEGEKGEIPVDVMAFNGRYAINVVNVGFDCEVVRRAAVLKKKPMVSGKMAYMLGVTSCNLLMLDINTVPEATFADDAVMKSFPYDVFKTIKACSVLGLMQGNPDGKFNPKNGGTRAEAITVINRVHDLIAPYYTSAEDYEAEYNKLIAESIITYTDIPKGHPVATITLEDGRKIKMELYPEYAPQTVAHFVKLANSGFYKGVDFHRIVPDFVAQAGKNMQLTDGVIKGEFSENGFAKNTLKHTKGVVSFARAQHNDTGSNQFFICLEDTPMLDGKYAAFGKVISGMDTVLAFEKVELEEGSSGEISSPVKPIVIKDIRISR